MRPALPLRGKILLITVLPLVSLALGTVWTLNRSLERRTQDAVRDDLSRASALFEHLVGARARALGVAGEVVVRDPRFFSVLTIPGRADDPQIRATVSGVAADFNSVTRTDLFEVYDRAGRLLAATGSDIDRTPGLADAATAEFVAPALHGHPAHGIMVEDDVHFQVVTTPVTVDGHVVGVLLLAADMGRAFAEQLRDLTRSEVTFIAGDRVCASTMDSRPDRDATLARMPEVRPRPLDLERGTILDIHGPTHTYLTLVRRIPDSKPAAGQLYVMQRALDAETAFLRDIQSHLLAIGVAAVVLAVLAGFLIAGRIVAPVRRLVRGAEEMERGNYDFPLEIRSRDEIGYLAERFSDMREHQRLYVGSLEDVTRLKSEFISIASHELRTPITILRGFQELMVGETLGPVTAQQRHALQGMEQSLGTLTRIAEDATRMALIESERLQLRLEPCSLTELVAGAVRAARAAAPERQVELVDATDPNEGTVELDAPRLSVAITNLLQNGIRFTPDGGRVEVSGRREQGWVVVTVSDTGIGIPEERRRRLEHAAPVRDAANHHSSSRLEFNSAGLGLGLSIARGIVIAHGGTLSLESTPGRGTRVTIRVPARPVERMRRAA